ncbi:MAG: hypothetical protein WBO55_10700 [Rhizobiaceae bacterium]
MSVTTLGSKASAAPGEGIVQRPTNRRASQKLGYLQANGQTIAVPCMVHELAPGQARLNFGGWMGVPESFSLFVEPDGVRLECQVQSRKGSSVTVLVKGERSERRPRNAVG